MISIELFIVILVYCWKKPEFQKHSNFKENSTNYLTSANKSIFLLSFKAKRFYVYNAYCSSNRNTKERSKIILKTILFWFTSKYFALYTSNDSALKKYKEKAISVVRQYAQIFLNAYTGYCLILGKRMCADISL